MSSSIDKIAYLVPSEEQISSTERILQRDVDAGSVVVMAPDLLHFQEEYQRIVDQQFVAIIARGGMYKEFSNVATSIPVFEDALRTSDVVTHIALIQKQFEGRNITIHVCLQTGIAQAMERAASAFRFRVLVHRYTSLHELKLLLQEIPEEDTVVLGSNVIKEMIGDKPLTFHELTLNEHTIRGTVERTQEVLRQLRDSAARTSLLNSVWDNVDEGILTMDDHLTITMANNNVSKFLNIPLTRLIGAAADELIENMPERRRDGTCSIDNPATFLYRSGKYTLSATIFPFTYYQNQTNYIMTIRDVTRVQREEQSIRKSLSDKGLTARYHFRDILTKNKRMKELIREAEIIAGSEGSVTISGESGTGKELFAQSIHNASRRKNGPFVVVNCAALNESLLESELFGYIEGAFTGARKGGKIGLFELAHKGTIFLDEVNSMPASLQAKLLRVLEQQEVMRVGSDRVIPINIRVLCASGTDLFQNVSEGKFRADLYYRLNTFSLNLPPVRERREDILPLFRLHAAAQKNCDPEDITLSEDLEQKLLAHDWPGNVREIKNSAIRFAAFEGTGLTDVIAPTAPSGGNPLVDADLKIDLKELDHAIENQVVALLQARGLTKSDIARALGISRQALYNKLHK